MCSSCTELLNNIARCPRPTNPQEGISCQDTPADSWQLNFWVHHKPNVRKMGSLGEGQMCGLHSVFFQNYICRVNGLQKITYSAQCQSTWSEPSVMSWSAWLGLGVRQCLSQVISANVDIRSFSDPLTTLSFQIYVQCQECFQTEIESSLKSKNPNTAGTSGGIRLNQVGKKWSRRQAKICSWLLAENSAKNMRGCNSSSS